MQDLTNVKKDYMKDIKDKVKEVAPVEILNKLTTEDIKSIRIGLTDNFKGKRSTCLDNF